MLYTINPFRYRGYFYDVETGLYYLQSRYYIPQWGRFLNPDACDVALATPYGLTDKNLFAYCDNNPVMRVDGDGAFWDILWDIFSFGASIVEVCLNPTDPWAWAGLVGDAIDLIPFVTGVGETTRAVNAGRKVAGAVDDIVDAADTVYDTARVIDNAGEAINTVGDVRKVGWKVGDDITNLTKAGKDPSWTTVRQRYWKNQALTNTMEMDADNLARMRKGLAPIVEGAPMELHHPYRRGGSNFYVFEPLTKAEHHFRHYGW